MTRRDPHSVSCAADAGRRRFVSSSALALAACAALPGLAFAQESLKQATILVGSPAGGATDKLARFFAEGLHRRFADTVVVENKPGAGGAIAYEYVKNSRQRDGSLVFLSPAYPIVMAPHIRELPYDPLRDFVPVAITARSGMAFVVGSSVPASVKTLADYLQWAKANPKSALYGAQNGSTQHLVGSILALVSKVPLDNVSYKGDAPAVQDLLGGHLPALVLPIASALPLQKAGQARVLAVTRSQRSRFLPDVPTFTELGFKEVVAQDWMGVFAPAGTPPAVVKKLNDAIAEVAKSPQGAEAFATLGFEPELAAPDAFAEMVKADHRRYAGLIERTGFKAAFEKAAGTPAR